MLSDTSFHLLPCSHSNPSNNNSDSALRSPSSFPACLQPPPIVGRLPAPTACHGQPLLVRGRAYCGADFRRRAVIWYVSEQEAVSRRRQAETAKAATTAKATKATKATKVTMRKTAKKPTQPTRLQPARAAKRPRSYAEDESEDGGHAAPPQAKQPRHCAPDTDDDAARGHDYERHGRGNTAPEWDNALQRMGGAEPFRQALDASLDQAIARLTTAATEDPVAAGWCPVVAQPLACTEMAYCLHGIGQTENKVSGDAVRQAPEARMEAPSSAALAAATREPVVAQDDGQIVYWKEHIEARTVRLGGLLFAVDTCSGAAQVWVM